MEPKTNALRKNQFIMIIVVIAAIAILTVVLIASRRSDKPREIDAPYGPKPFDLKSLKTSISPASENISMPEVDDTIDMDY